MIIGGVTKRVDYNIPLDHNIPNYQSLIIGVYWLKDLNKINK